MTERKSVDWEAIEREYRAGQCSVAEIGRRFGISHPAILKRAKRDGWTRNLAAKVREAVTAKLVTSEVTGAAGQRETIEAAAARVVQVIREHRTSIGRAQRLVKALFGELEEATENRDEIDEAIEAESRDEDKGKRRAMMLRAVALPSRSGVIVNLSGALKTLVALERQAFGLDAEVPTGNYTISDRPMSDDEWSNRCTSPD